MFGFPQRAAAGGLIAAAAVFSWTVPVHLAQEQQPTFRAGANIVRVDVTVTNNHGEPATNLTRDDFVVTEDGAPQTIDSIELVRLTGEPTDDRSLEIYSQSQMASEAARDDVRLFLIFWDEYHIGEFLPATRGRDVLTNFVLNAFGPSDLVGIMDQLTTVDSIRFTRDRRELANEVHALKGRFNVFVPVRSAVEEAQLQARDVGRIRNEVTTTALNAAAAFLGNFREGRKALLFVSQGIPLFGRNDETTRYNEIVHTANTNNTAIYTLDPMSEVGRRPDSLMSLAEETGGRPFVGTNRPELMVPQMVRDSSAYYLLGYRSPAPADGKFHRIKVRVNKDGYEVRARSGYFAPSVGEIERGRAKAAASEVPADIEHAVGELSAAERSDRRIDYWIGMSRGGGGQTHVTIAWAPRGPASTSGDVTLTVLASSPTGPTYFTSNHTTSRELSFDAPPGELLLATTALDGKGDEIDTEKRHVTVPVFEEGRLAMGSPVVFRARTARDVRAIADETAHPEVGRTFERTDRLFARIPVYGGGDTTVSARLLNQRGAQLRAIPLVAEKEGVYHLELPLGVVAPGDYVIEIDATRGTETAKALVPLRAR